MARYRITTTDGGEQVVVAMRLRRDGDRLAFLAGAPESPRLVHDVEAQRVAAIARRITELNGMHRWISEPVPAVGGPGRERR